MALPPCSKPSMGDPLVPLHEALPPSPSGPKDQGIPPIPTPVAIGASETGDLPFGLLPDSHRIDYVPSQDDEQSSKSDALQRALERHAMGETVSADAILRAGSTSPVHSRSSISSSGLDLATERPNEGTASYDWLSFLSAYAAGRWDPHRIPKFPGSNVVNPTPQVTATAMLDESAIRPEQSQSAPSLLADILEDRPMSEAAEATSPPVSQASSRPSSADLAGFDSRLRPTAKLGMKRAGPGSIPLPSTRMRPSWDARTSAQSPAPLPSPALAAEAMTSAAAIRWAGARISVSPLVLPSPERELTDPFHGATYTLPGLHPPDSPVMTPGGTRLSKFWIGTQDVDDSTFLHQPGDSPDVEDEPALDGLKGELAIDFTTRPSQHEEDVSTPKTGDSSTTTPRATERADPVGNMGGSATTVTTQPPQAMRRRSFVPPASAPLPSKGEELSGDYFTTPEGPRSPDMPPHRASRAQNSSFALNEDLSPSTVPAAPRRTILARQASAPLPAYAQQKRAHRKDSAGQRVSRAARTAHEEQLFMELGYLSPPMPPDELERRRALYKFNIWKTGADPNFDRIVHLAKLVFNTKVVVISLCDGEAEWFKAQTGLPYTSWFRPESLAAHAILQRGDEPMIALNLTDDWRFAKNPLVAETLKLRFMACAPLRTTDGFNIGCLTIMDDSPRSEFSPRQRHTLKEFAAVAMRELELWRDKIQLRIRDRIQSSMEQFTKECLEINGEGPTDDMARAGSMDRIYGRAARLVKKTLDVQEAFVLDVSISEVLETIDAEATVSVSMYGADQMSPTQAVSLNADEVATLNAFFERFPDGRISEAVPPAALRRFMPQYIQYALVVPIVNMDKRPFALLCAYNTSDHTTRYLEGHELSYLRAIGVIILSAVLKRRMILADKAKSLFISNISHELRTPLHGILAAAELLADSGLTPSQMSFIQTVQACGTSLVETVNHVLDFTKLSGNTRSGGLENSMHRTKADMLQLVEEAVEGSWIGYQARMTALESDIGSVYAPPKSLSANTVDLHVETVIDIGRRAGGWVVNCEKSGMRRVLMNIFGNSLKFTSNGYIHVSLREVEPEGEQAESDKVILELSVLDTGKGISQDFLKNQLFHPFSQENPLQTGTGLGLAIVNSIVRSSSVDGHVEVSSAENVGTEIRVTFTAERLAAADQTRYSDMEPFVFADASKRPSASLHGFHSSRRGEDLLHTVLSTNLLNWGIEVLADGLVGHIMILNEDDSLLLHATEARDPSRPFVILTAQRGSKELAQAVADYERIGGFARLVFKPGGPSRIRTALKLCLHALNMTQRSRTTSMASIAESVSAPASIELSAPPRPFGRDSSDLSNSLPRRNSEDKRTVLQKRPSLGPRASTLATTPIWLHEAHTPPATVEEESLLDVQGAPTPTLESLLPTPPPSSVESPPTAEERASSSLGETAEDVQTLTLSGGGSVLKASVTSETRKGKVRVLVIEDNSILRNLLNKWLKSKGFDYRDAVDGRDGVNVFEQDGHFDVVLLDLSMPLLDGIGATHEIRAIETSRRAASTGSPAPPARILALTGMSSLDHKKRAFEAGVDGYLVKPVAFKALDDMFQKLGLS